MKRSSRLLCFLLPFCLSADEVIPWEVFFVLNNDFLTNNTINDDFYTSSLRLEVSQGKLAFRAEEHAFTDQEAGFRFDESYFTTGRLLTAEKLGDLCIWLEGGVAYLGKGLLGQGAQNTLHKWFGDDPVFLDYLPGLNEYHPHFRTEIGQQWKLSETFSLGPQTAFSITPGFRWNAFAGARTIWRPSENFSFDLMVGQRLARSELDLLKSRLKDSGLEVQVRLDLPYGFLLEWSLNRFGTDREHVSIGYHIGRGESPRRHGAWIQANAAP